jgi:hypothetical protein
MLGGEGAEAACSTARSRGAASGLGVGSRDVASGAARGFIGRQPAIPYWKKGGQGRAVWLLLGVRHRGGPGLGPGKPDSKACPGPV